MYRLARFMLIAAVLIVASAAVVVVKLYPGILVVTLVVLALRSISLSRRRSTAHGTARWAEPGDVPRMLETLAGYINESRGANEPYTRTGKQEIHYATLRRRLQDEASSLFSRAPQRSSTQSFGL